MKDSEAATLRSWIALEAALRLVFLLLGINPHQEPQTAKGHGKLGEAAPRRLVEGRNHLICGPRRLHQVLILRHGLASRRAHGGAANRLAKIGVRGNVDLHHLLPGKHLL